MKPLRSLLLSATALLAAHATAQAPAPSAAAWDARYLERKGQALEVLTAWGGANVLAGGALGLASDDECWRQFGWMSAGWGAINAGLGLLGVRADRTEERSLEQAHRDLARTERIFLFNAGLDVAYVLGGAYLVQRGRLPEHADTRDRDNGWGRAVMLQGLGLFAFDLLAYRHVHRSDLDIAPVLRAGGGLGLSATLKL